MLHIKLKSIEHHASTYSVLTRSLRWGQKVKTFFLKIVMLHIKLKGLELRAPCKHIFCPNTHPRPVGSVQKVKTFSFLNVVMLHIKRNGIVKDLTNKNFDLTHIPGIWAG